MTTQLTEAGQKLTDELVRAGVLTGYLPDSRVAKLNTAAQILLTPEGGGGLREALDATKAVADDLAHVCIDEGDSKAAGALQFISGFISDRLFDLSPPTGSAGDDDTGVREALKALVEHIHASRYRCDRTGLRLDANRAVFDQAERALAAQPVPSAQSEEQCRLWDAIHDAMICAWNLLDGTEDGVSGVDQADWKALSSSMTALEKLVPEEEQPFSPSYAVPYLRALAAQRPNAEPPSGWKNEHCNGNPEAAPAPDKGELEDAVEVLRANDAPACAEAVERAMAALAPQPPKAETPAGVGEVWHRDGATIYTLKEYDGPYMRSGPRMVNEHFFLVQGPDAEAVAARVHAALSLAPAARAGDGVEALRPMMERADTSQEASRKADSGTVEIRTANPIEAFMLRVAARDARKAFERASTAFVRAALTAAPAANGKGA